MDESQKKSDVRDLKESLTELSGSGGRLYRTYRSSRDLSRDQVPPKSLSSTFKIFDSRYSKYLPIDKNVRIIEIGCGDGNFISFLLSKGFKRVEGVDLSPQQAEVAKSLGRHQVILADNCDRLKQLKGEVDMIVALDVIEHYNKSELLTLLDAVYGALKDTGIFLVQTPNADGPFGARHRYSDFTHELAFTPSSLSQALKIAGFKRIEFAPVGPIIHGIVSLIRWCVWKIIQLPLILYLAAETGYIHGYILTQNYDC